MLFQFHVLPQENNLGENINTLLCSKKRVTFPAETTFKLVLEKYFNIIKSKMKRKCTVLLPRVIFPAACSQNSKWNVLYHCESHFTSILPRVSAADTKRCCLQICVADLASWFLIMVFTCVTGFLLTGRKLSSLPLWKMFVPDPLGMISRSRSHSIHFDHGVWVVGPPFFSSGFFLEETSVVDSKMSYVLYQL